MAASKEAGKTDYALTSTYVHHDFSAIVLF